MSKTKSKKTLSSPLSESDNMGGSIKDELLEVFKKFGHHDIDLSEIKTTNVICKIWPDTKKFECRPVK